MFKVKNGKIGYIQLGRGISQPPGQSLAKAAKNRAADFNGAVTAKPNKIKLPITTNCTARTLDFIA